MAVVIRRFDGQDLVIAADDLSKIGVRAGQFVAVRPMQPLPLLLTVPETEEVRARRRDLQALWQAHTAGDDSDGESLREDLWEQWSDAH